jgi:hypothetical protein
VINDSNKCFFGKIALDKNAIGQVSLCQNSPRACVVIIFLCIPLFNFLFTNYQWFCKILISQIIQEYQGPVQETFLQLHFKKFQIFCRFISPGNPYWKGKLSTVDLLALTSLNQFILILKILLTFVSKQATLMKRSTVLSHPVQVVFPGLLFWGTAWITQSVLPIVVGSSLGTTTLSITTFSIMTLSIQGLFATLRITLSTTTLSIKSFFVTLSVTTLCHYAECRYDECHYA